MTETVGSVTLRTTYTENGTQAVSAIQMDPVTAVGVEFLHEIMTNGDPLVRVVDNRLILELANGTWTYQLGEYNPAQRGIMARLIDGEPLPNGPASTALLSGHERATALRQEDPQDPAGRR